VSPECLLALQKEKAAPRNHYVHILQQDLDHLEPGEYWNNCVVDYWMMWITRKEPAEDNNFIIYNTQFNTALETLGIS
jgi:Ulp1 family protease